MNKEEGDRILRKLSDPYEIVSDPGETKSKILLESAKMFAYSGYSAVSVRDIAAATGIQPGSIYTHFPSKQGIFEAMMERCKEVLLDFYQILDERARKEKCFADILDNIFLTAREVTNPFVICTVWSAMHTQFEFEISRHLYYDIYFVKGNLSIQRQLQVAIDRGLAAPFDVQTIASFITSSLITSLGFHVGYLNGFYKEFSVPDWYAGQLKHILHAIGV